MSENIQFGIYAEHSCHRGGLVSDADLEDRPNCNDWNIYEGTAAELVAQAEYHERLADKATGGHGQYLAKVARTLREVASAQGHGVCPNWFRAHRGGKEAQ